MPTIIDSLIVTLGLDSKDMDAKSSSGTKKLKELEGQAGKTETGVKKIGTTAKSTASGVDVLTRSLASFLALIGGTMAIRAFVEDTIASSAALDRLSKNLGLSVETVSAWGNAVEEMGGSAKGLQGTMDMLSKSQTEMRLKGESALIPYFSALGVSLSTVDGKARPVSDILLTLADRFSHMDRTTANNMGRMMGIDQDTMNLLLQGRGEVELMIKRQKEYGAVSKEQAEQAVKLQRSMVDLKQSFTAFGRDLLQQAAPALEKLLDAFAAVGNWARANKEFIVDFLGVMAVGLGALALATLPLTGTVAAITAVGAAIAALYQDYQTWKRGGDSLIDWAKWEPGIEAAKQGIQDLAKIAKEAFGAIYHEANGMWKALHGDFSGAKAEFNLSDQKVLGTVKTAVDSGHAEANTYQRVRGAGVTASDAQAQANRVSAMTGIPADILFAQWKHETGNFTNRGATSLHNLAGVNIPGGKGKDYRNFESLDAFGNYYAHLMREGGRYSAARDAKTPEQFAAALKAGGYYADSQSNYAAGIRRSMTGISGASNAAQLPARYMSTMGSGDTTTTTHIGEVKIYTQATDAQGIMRDMNFLFAGQANAGLR